MKCQTCQYELSQCLDGRLPSGRRAVVMDHVATCDACERFWRELQAAQALVLNLPRLHVGADFRDGLFERIQTGEGTPTAVFREQVSLGTKVRYLVTGAAAAAAVLTAAVLWRAESTPRPSTSNDLAAAGDLVATPPVANGAGTAAPRAEAVLDEQPHVATLAGAGVAHGDAAPPAVGGYLASPQASPLAPRESLLSSVKPLTPDLIAVETARQFEQRHRWATHRLNLLTARDADAAEARVIRDQAVELDKLGSVLSDLRDRNWLSFQDPQVDADLRVFLGLLDRDAIDHTDDADVVRRIVGPALRKSSSLGHLTTAMSVTPSFDVGARLDDLMRVSPEFPEVIGQIFFVLPSTDPIDLDPRELSRTFRLQDSCGTVYVTPMSEVQGARMVFRRLQGRIDLRIDGRGDAAVQRDR